MNDTQAMPTSLREMAIAVRENGPYLSSDQIDALALMLELCAGCIEDLRKRPASLPQDQREGNGQ